MKTINTPNPNSELETYLRRIRPRRKVTGIAAALLPFDAQGQIS